VVDDVSYQLGEIKGLLSGLREDVSGVKTAVVDMDDRLRKVETKAAINGAVSGGVIGVVIAGIAAGFKASSGGV
tara:strand:- start:70143 stop:70364 length:222 start_codon:yes stop_codon:yes gene_type:complete